MCLYNALTHERGPTLCQKLKHFYTKYKSMHPIVSFFTALNVATFTGLNAYWTFITFRTLGRNLRNSAGNGRRSLMAMTAAAAAAAMSDVDGGVFAA
jgi:hypothetical protein